MAAALGMLAGDTAAGRFVPPHWRRRVVTPMRLLLAAPYLLFAFAPPVPLAVAFVALASVGFSATLLQQERLAALTPPELQGQSMGLQSAGMMTAQGVCAALAGAVAELVDERFAITSMALLSLAVSLALTRGLRRAHAERPIPAGGP